MATRRPNRAESKARTRERLLAATERLATREGFARITLDRVAEAAGLTKGAVYSNFASKEELLLEVAMRLTRHLDFGGDLEPMPDLRATLDYLGGALADAARTRPKEGVLALEFVTLAIRDRRLKRVLMAERAGEEDRQPTDRWIAAHRDEFPLKPEAFFEVLNALAWGLLLRRLLVGAELLPDDLMAWAFTRLLPWSDDSSG